MASTKLEKKVALVTGGGSGIGRAVSTLFAENGAAVVVADFDERGGKETVDLVKGKAGRAMFVKVDTASAKDNEEMVKRTVSEFGGLDIAVNNAGIGGPSAPVGEYPIEGWERVLAVNLSGVFYGMRYELPAIVKRGGGAIVNMSSILGQVGFRNSAAYVAAKHGMLGLTKNAALEYASQKIRVNAVGPGFIKTPLLDKNLDEKTLAAIAAMHPMGRLGEASEVAELVLWLSCEASSFVTGGYYAVDGGYLAQ